VLIIPIVVHKDCRAMAGLSLKTLCICASALTFLGLAHAHGESKGHQQPIKVDPNAPWAVRHMQGEHALHSPRSSATNDVTSAEEHHISYFDPGAFFSFHDFDDNGFWDGAEIQKFYGLDDPSAKDVSYEKRHEVVDKIMELMDKNDDGMVSHDEWMRFSDGGSQLPDFGLGPGHHWDMETEYEIHHVSLIFW